jgi:phosphatidylglycerol:prolipoprotein diacylglycerol transferase
MLGMMTWDIDPVLLHLGPLQIRYYGVLYAITIYTGFSIWRKQALRNGESHEFAEEFLWYGVIAILGGARLGHVFFYEYKTYLANPIEIIKFWKGGLASHGATVALIFALWLFARKHRKTWSRVADYLAPAIALAAGGVRLGNFFNSEIVGRVTDVPWGVKFVRYCAMERLPLDQCQPRHPSQFYEFLMGLFVFGVLMWLQKRNFRRAGSGLTTGVFLTLYFGIRFLVENFKEFQDEQLRTEGFLGTIEQALGRSFTTGQYLSVPLVLFGLVMIVRALRQPKDAIPEPTPTPDLPPEPVATPKR